MLGKMRAGALLTLSIAVLLTAPAAKAASLVANGDFELNGGLGQVGGGVSSLSSWTVGATTKNDAALGFVFVVDATADSAGFPSVNTPSLGTNIYVWGPNTPAGHGGPVANGFTGSANGGFFLGGDGDYANAPVSQSIAGLTIGETYTLSFEWAASQFTDATGATTQKWDVSFGSDNVSTPTFNLPSQGFSGWMLFSHDFTASATTQTLSFLANGGPAGLPPFLLMDGVSLTQSTPGPSPVPEPSTFISLGIGSAGLIAAGWKRRRNRRSA